MTREEAINIMKVIVHMLEEKYDTDRVEDAVDMAIKALEQQPNIDMDSEEIKILQKRSYLEGFHEALKMSVKQEPCDDCISRQEVIKITDGVNDLPSQKLDKILSLPSIQPKPKTDVLDKIKAEIEEQVLESLSDGGDDWFVAEKVNECLEIIDKYKAESEDKE